ncbi:hypothetical protein YC2023_030660 [Brassica napus]
MKKLLYEFSKKNLQLISMVSKLGKVGPMVCCVISLMDFFISSKNIFSDLKIIRQCRLLKKFTKACRLQMKFTKPQSLSILHWKYSLPMFSNHLPKNNDEWSKLTKKERSYIGQRIKIQISFGDIVIPIEAVPTSFNGFCSWFQLQLSVLLSLERPYNIVKLTVFLILEATDSRQVALGGLYGLQLPRWHFSNNHHIPVSLLVT